MAGAGRISITSGSAIYSSKLWWYDMQNPMQSSKQNIREAQFWKRLDQESEALFGTARLWDDGIIDPRDTRRLLGMCLAMAEESRARQLHANTFGVARL